MQSTFFYYLFFVGAISGIFCLHSTAGHTTEFSTALVTKTTAHPLSIEVDITDAKQLVLQVTDGGDSSAYDWANWISPTLVGPNGSKRLTELKWKHLSGKAEVGKSNSGQPLKVNGESVEYGIGTHAPSMIVYDLPPGYASFRCRVGLDDGGTDQEGSTSSVVFRVLTDPETIVHDVTSLPGFRVQRLYAADLAQEGSWVAMGIDHRGRLIASDRQGPMYRIELPPVGVKNATATVKKMPVEVGHANGLLTAFGSLYVVGKGYGNWDGKSGLFRLTDTTGDDRYDKVEHLIPLTVGGDHHAHAVILGPQQKRLLILCGNSTDLPDDIAIWKIHQQSEDHLLPRSTYYGHNTGRMAPGGFILSCKLDGTDRMIHCSGFRNPYDFALNADGELFTYDSDMEFDVGSAWYRPTRVNHCLSGAEFGWRYGAGKWPSYYPDSFSSVIEIGRGSPTGVVFGYGTKFPEKYQRALFICDWTYGRIHAVHLRPSGASYLGDAELFVSGRAMPVSDLVINPNDGALYYITGGRRNETALFRVTYTGDESTEPVLLESTDSKSLELRQLRRGLEEFHGSAHSEAVDAAWPYLSHADRAIRLAARTAIEHQPVEQWIERATWETNEQAIIEAMIAAARSDEAEHQGDILNALQRIDFVKLDRERKLALLRAYALTFIRLGTPGEATVDFLSNQLSQHYPTGDTHLDRELCRMLLYLNATDVVTTTVKQLMAADTQADQMFYAYHLRTIKDGWNSQDLQSYFRWIQQAEVVQADYTGGGHFSNFLKTIREESLQRLSEEEVTTLKPILDGKSNREPPSQAMPRSFVREWTLESLQPAMSRVETGRSFIRGKRLYTELCSKCHLFLGKGGALGPDLTSAGNKLKPSALLTEIITPSKVISDQHASVILELDSGKIITGREIGGNEDSVKIAGNADNPDAVQEIPKAEIVSRVKSPVSMMPTDLLNTLNEGEVLDLMMYVLSGGQVEHTAFQQ